MEKRYCYTHPKECLDPNEQGIIDHIGYADIYDQLTRSYLSFTGYIDRIAYHVTDPSIEHHPSRLALMIMADHLSNDYHLYQQEVDNFLK